MADNLVTQHGQCIATDEIAGCHHFRTKLTFGVDGSFVDVSATNPLPITGGGSSGGLTDAELRATPVPVSVSGTVAVSGPLTDAQLRASPLGVSGAFYQATQPVSIASMPSTASDGHVLADDAAGFRNGHSQPGRDLEYWLYYDASGIGRGFGADRESRA
jgi:hypothetical protein